MTVTETPTSIRVTIANTAQENKRLIIGTVVGAVLVAIIISLVLLVVVAVCRLKAKGHHSTITIDNENSNEVPTDANDDIHYCPIVDHAIDTRQNEAYNKRKNRPPNIEVKQNVAYDKCCGNATQRNGDYAYIYT